MKITSHASAVVSLDAAEDNGVMRLENIAEYYNDISGIPTAILGNDGVEAAFSVRSFTPSLAQFHIAPILNEQTKLSVDATVSDDQVICGFVIDIKSSRALLLGPVMEHPCTRRTALSILKRMKVPLKRADELVHYFEKIPCMALSVFVRNLFFLNYIINDSLPPENPRYKEMVNRLTREKTEDISVQENALTHNPREWDSVLESCIQYGKLDELEVFMRRIGFEGKMGITAGDSLRSFKNVAIASIALESRAAARGGMEYEDALTLSDEYIRRIEEQNHYDEVAQVLSESFYVYTRNVAELRSLQTDSKLVFEVIQYTKKHLYKSIKVSEMAEALGYSASYLCRDFRKETGKTIKEYINQIKLKEAQFLLRSTDHSIADIAMALGYSSQAYFTTLFKEFSGSTPQEFRSESI